MEEAPGPLPVGAWEVLRPGGDLTLVAVGSCVGPALEAAEALEAEGLHVGVVNARFVKPLDTALLGELAASGAPLLTAEEGVLAGGFGEAVLGHFAEHGPPAVRVACAGIPDEFVEHGSQQALRARYGIDAAGLAGRVRRLLAGRESADRLRKT